MFIPTLAIRCLQFLKVGLATAEHATAQRDTDIADESDVLDTSATEKSNRQPQEHPDRRPCFKQ